MTFPRKTLLAALAGAALLGGCATGPYYDNYGYDSYGYGNTYGYGAGYNAPYYGPAYGSTYVAPSIGLGLTYSDQDYNRGYRNREWRGDNRDRRNRDGRRDLYRDGQLQEGWVAREEGWVDRDGGRVERDGHGNLYYAPDGGKAGRDANSASPG